MKIIYIHQYFFTPAEPGGTRSYWISRALIEKGHQVIMLTSTNKYHPREGIEIIDGIKVKYIKSEYNNYMSKLAKVKSFVNFMYKSLKAAIEEKNIDIVFATSTPLTVGGTALLLKRLKHWPYVFEVRDLWPEFPIQIGAIKNKVLIKLLKVFEKQIYKYSNHVVALSPGMAKGVIEAGTPKEKVTMVPNMSKPEEFFPHEPNMKIAEKFGIDTSCFNVIHFGSMGRANGLQYIIEVARLCKQQDVNDVKFLFMGDGATLPELKKMVEDYQLNNVQFLGDHGMEIVAEVVNLCDLSVTSFLNLPILQTNSPNKLFDSLSAGKPIVVNSAGWTKDLVEQEECGFFVDPTNPQDFVNKLEDIKSNIVLLERWGKNSRRLSLDKFNRSILADKVVQSIEKASLN